jgi:hypothetical protein
MLADEIELEIKRLPPPGSGVRATVHIFRQGRWWPPDTRICVSERDAMIWINSRLALRGFEEAYDVAGGAHVDIRLRPGR